MRKRIYEIIEKADGNNKLSRFYDISMIIIIIVSLIPIAAKSTEGVFKVIEIATTAIFVIDYILRLITADFKLNRGIKSFFIYIITPMAIIDLISILPSILPLYGTFKILRIIRVLRTLRVFKVFKIIRYSKSVRLIINVLKKQKESLVLVFLLAIGYILVSALLIISIEPDTFDNFFDAVYWAAISLTSVGYGDIYAVTDAGRIITIISTLFGLAVVAMPMGIITAGILDELKNMNNEKTKDE